MRQLALGALVLALTIAGCGGDDRADGGGGTNTAFALLDAAVAGTEEVESFRQEFTLESDIGGQTMSVTGNGVFSADNQRGRMELSSTIDGEELQFEALAVDGTAYLRGPDLPVPAGKKWLETTDPPTSTMSPGEFVRFLRESGQVEEVGTEDVRGEPATHLRGPLDLEKLAEAESSPAVLERLRQTPEARQMKLMVDLWVPESGLPSRMALEITHPEAAGSMNITSEILEYDVELDVEAPPANTVATG